MNKLFTSIPLEETKGSPLGYIIANIFMANVELKYEIQNTTHHPKYVHDTLSICDGTEHDSRSLNHLNNYHPNITCENEYERDNMIIISV